MSGGNRSIQGKAIQTLISLGLTPCQAKIYFPLSKNVGCTAKTISQISEVARPDVYRVMSQLEKTGLVKKILSTPTKWEAVPTKEGFDILLERRKKEYSEIQKETKTIINKIGKTKGKKEFPKDEAEFAIIPGKKATKLWVKKYLENTQKSIEGIFSVENINIMIFNERERYKRALKRGVKIRFICCKPENEKQTLKMGQIFWKDPNFQIRYITGNPPSVMAVLDGKRIIMNITSNLRDPAEKPNFTSTNTALIQTLQNYFEKLWKNAHKNPNKNA